MPVRTPATKKEIQDARNMHHCDEVNIDDDALASRADTGVWVQAWVWLDKSDDETEAKDPDSTT